MQLIKWYRDWCYAPTAEYVAEIKWALICRALDADIKQFAGVLSAAAHAAWNRLAEMSAILGAALQD